jgi:UDPglucose 6-dehydrogenase
VLLHLTEWREFRDADPEEVGSVMSARCLLVGRNKLDLAAWRAAGFEARGLGLPLTASFGVAGPPGE